MTDNLELELITGNCSQEEKKDWLRKLATEKIPPKSANEVYLLLQNFAVVEDIQLKMLVRGACANLNNQFPANFSFDFLISKAADSVKQPVIREEIKKEAVADSLPSNNNSSKIAIDSTHFDQKIEKKNQGANFYLALMGSFLMILGVFCPFFTIPSFMGNPGQTMNYFRNGKGDGVFIIFLALISVFSVLKGKISRNKIIGVVVVGMLINSAWLLNNAISVLGFEVQWNGNVR